MKSTIPVTSLQRLPVYLNYLKSLSGTREFISSGAIAHALNMGEVLVRKDLAFTSAQGRTRVGYNTCELIAALEEYLGCNEIKNAVIFGAGGLGSALLSYGGFGNYGIRIVSAFDNNPLKKGSEVSGKPVLGVEEAPGFISRNNVKLAVICVPAKVAQEVTDILVGCNVKSILNFAPAQLTVPEGFNVRNIDVAANLAILSTLI